MTGFLHRDTCEPIPKPKKAAKGRGMYGRGSHGKATELHAKIVRSRGACENCGSRQNLQCAHIVRRGFSATRTDEANAFCLCARCHHRFTNWPDEWLEFVYLKIGREAYSALKSKAESRRGKFDWDAELARLREVAGRLEVA